MARNINFLFAILAVVLIASMALAARGCFSRRVPEFVDPKVTLDEAVERSMESGRPVLAIVGADWCPHCAAFADGTLSDPAVVAWAKEKSEAVYVDASRNREPRVQEVLARLRVYSLPAVVLMRGRTHLGTVEGNIPAADLLRWLNEKTAPPGS